MVRARRFAGESLVVVFLSLWTGVLSAQVPTDTADAEARANFEAGRLAFADARFADALPYFERAYQLSQRDELLYNIGVCHDRLGHDAEALAAFEAYLEAIPDAPNRAEVEQRIVTARERASRSAPQRTAPTPDAPAPASDPTGWVLVGIGGALVVAGAVLLGVGRADVGAVESTEGTLSWTEAMGVVERADALSIAGIAGLGVGAALLGVGLGVALSSSSDRDALSLRFGPGVLTLRGRF